MIGSSALWAQAPQAGAAPKVDKASAYYHYALAHMYAEQASMLGNRGDFVNKAIERNVLIIPGNVFSSRDTHFRLSYATTDAKLDQGIAILRELGRSLA